MQEILTFKISCLRFKETDRLAVLTILTSYQSTVKRVSKFILFLNFWGIEEPNSSHVNCIIMFFIYEYTLLESHGKIKILAYKKQDIQSCSFH